MIKKVHMAILALAWIACSAGCQRPERTPQEEQSAASSPLAAPPSTAQTVIDGFTGRTAVDKGLEARQIIQEAEAKRNRDLEQVFEE